MTESELFFFSQLAQISRTLESHRIAQDITMARKKRTDEAAAGGAAPPSTAKQTEGMASKSSDAKQTNDTKSGPTHWQGHQSEKGGEATSRRGGASPPSSAKKPAEEDVNGPASSPGLGSCSTGQTSSEQAAGGVGALRGVAVSEGQSILTQQRRVVDMTGLSASQKKNLKKKLRKQEQKLQEAELNIAVQVDAGATSLASHLDKVVKDWKAQLAELETRSKTVGPGPSANQFYDAAEELVKVIKATRDEEVNKAKKPIDKQATVQEIQCKIREAELAVQKNQKEVKRVSHYVPGDVSNADLYAAQKKVEESVRYVLHLREQLILTQQRKDLRAFQQSAAEIRASVEHLIKLVQKRPPQKAAQESASQQREAIWRKRLQALGGGPHSGDVGSLSTVSVSLPEHAAYILLTPQGQPSLMSRKVERKFNVLLEKKQKGDITVTFSIVGYTPEACKECSIFLNESNFPEIPIGFTTSPNCVSLEGQNIGAFIGSSGSNVRKLEAEHDVLLFLEDSWITVLGREAAVKKAIPHIKELSSPPSGRESGLPQSRCEFKPEIVRAMAQGSAATRAKVLEVETCFAVTIMTHPPRRTVLVKGSDAAACKKACTELENAFESFSFSVFECDKLKASRLLRSAAASFSHIHGHELISLMRCDTGVLVVGPADALSAAVEVLNGAMYQLSRASQTVEIKATELRILDRSKRGEIETLSGATCRPPVHEGDKATLTFTGHPDAVQKAVAMARQILVEQKEEELGCSAAAALQFLTDKSHRALEEEHGIRIRVDVPRGRLIVRGANGAFEAVTEAIRRVEQEVINNGKVCTKLDVPREAVPVILGRQGANVRRLQNECHLDNIVIDGRPDGRPQAVYMLGSQEAIAQATTMVQEIVANSSGVRQQNTPDGGAERRPRTGVNTTGRGGGRGGRGEYGGGAASRGKGGSGNRTAAATTAKPYNASVDDEDAFPSLGECLNRPGGRWKKAAFTEDVEEGAAAKSSSDAHGEAEEHGEGEFIEAGDSAN